MIHVRAAYGGLKVNGGRAHTDFARNNDGMRSGEKPHAAATTGSAARELAGGDGVVLLRCVATAEMMVVEGSE